MTHEIQLRGEPTFPVDPGAAVVRIQASDYRGEPVAGAKLSIEGVQRPDISAPGEIRELGEGLYEGTFRSHRAGEWSVTVQDPTTRVLERRCIFLLPGDPIEIRTLGTTDPRVEPPRGRLDLRAQLIDKFGNPLDPARLRAESDGKEWPRRAIWDEAVFRVSYPGYGHVPVMLRDTASSVSREFMIEFAAAVLEDPGLVWVGNRFETGVFGFLPPDRKGKRATIDVEYDAQRTRFLGVENGRREGPRLKVETTQTREGMVNLAVQAERDLSAEEFPDGIFIAEVEWECLEEGDSFFYLVGKMSPSTPKWELCVSQKEEHPKCICVNIIYKEGDAAAKAAGEAAAEEVNSILSGYQVLVQCCPKLTVQKHTCEISNADWNTQVRGAIGNDDKISSGPEWDALVALPLCKRDHCINLRMVAFNDPHSGGKTQVGSGESALDPNTSLGGGAHEIAHALGLTDLYRWKPDGTIDGGPTGNIMSWPIGYMLTKEQCKTVWANVDKYAC